MPADKELPAKVAFVGSDERDSGTLEMKQVCKLMGGKGEIVVLMGELSNQAARQRTQDVEDVIKSPECSGIKILDKQSGNWDRTQGTDLVTNWLSAGLKPNAIVSNNDEMAIGAIQALKQAGVPKGSIIVAGVDATQDGLAAMKAATSRSPCSRTRSARAGRGRHRPDARQGRQDGILRVGAVRARHPDNLSKYEAKN